MPISYSVKQIKDWLTVIAQGGHDAMANNASLAQATLGLIDLDTSDSIENLSPHFTLSELCHSQTAEERDIENVPNNDEIDQLDLLANRTLEKVRDICKGKPVLISSGFRCQSLNKAVGGASNSAHLHGAAADIVIPAFGNPLAVCVALFPHIKELEIDQLIYETNMSGGVWVHIGRAAMGTPRYQAFSIIQGVTQQTPFPAGT